jgi:flagellar biogenesis protein FliO
MPILDGPASASPAPLSGLTLSPGLPLRREPDADAFSALGLLLLVLLAGLGLAAAFLRSRRRVGAIQWDWRRALRLPASTSQLRVVESTRLDARASLYVLEWQGSRLLIARSEQTVTLLAQTPDPRAGRIAS